MVFWVRGLRSVFALALMVSACGGETASDSPGGALPRGPQVVAKRAVALLAQGAEYQKAAVGYGRRRCIGPPWMTTPILLPPFSNGQRPTAGCRRF